MCFEQRPFSLLFLRPSGSTRSVLQDYVYTRQIGREMVFCTAALARTGNSNTGESKNSCRKEQKRKRSGEAFWNSFKIILSSWDVPGKTVLPPTPSVEPGEKGDSTLWTIQKVEFVPTVIPSWAWNLPTSGRNKLSASVLLSPYLGCLADRQIKDWRGNLQENCEAKRWQ